MTTNDANTYWPSCAGSTLATNIRSAVNVSVTIVFANSRGAPQRMSQTVRPTVGRRGRTVGVHLIQAIAIARASAASSDATTPRNPQSEPVKIPRARATTARTRYMPASGMSSRWTRRRRKKNSQTVVAATIAAASESASHALTSSGATPVSTAR
jgi:hypothetical protein